MEHIDIVCEDGMPTGLRASREEVHRKGLWHRTVHIWLFNERGDVLLQKRSMNKESHPGLWDISCAGHISAGESSIEAALKELDEELGITAQGEDLEFLFSEKSFFVQQNGRYIDREIHDTYLLKKNIPAELINIHEGEVECVKYISFEEFEMSVNCNSHDMVPHEREYEQLMRLFGRGASEQTAKYSLL